MPVVREIVLQVLQELLTEYEIDEDIADYIANHLSEIEFGDSTSTWDSIDPDVKEALVEILTSLGASEADAMKALSATVEAIEQSKNEDFRPAEDLVGPDKNCSAEHREVNTVGVEKDETNDLPGQCLKLKSRRKFRSLALHSVEQQIPNQTLFQQNLDTSEYSYFSSAIDGTHDGSISQIRSTTKPVCRHFLAGGCFRADCEFTHDISNLTCKFWLRGECSNGDDCQFLHAVLSPEADIPAVPSHDVKNQGCRTNTPEDVEPVDPDAPFSFAERLKLKQLKQSFDSNLPDHVIEDIFHKFGRRLELARTALTEQYQISPLDVSTHIKAPQRCNSNQDNNIISSNSHVFHIPWLETGIVASETFEEHRAEAKQLSQARFACFARATQAFQNKRKAEATRWANEGKRLQSKIRAANARAAAHIFATRNDSLATSGNEVDAIDVHGLLVDEAISAVDSYMNNYANKELPHNASWLCVVTGTGHHSRIGHSTVRQALIKWLQEEQISFFETSRDSRGGMLMIQLSTVC